jgi:hypothetical protein
MMMAMTMMIMELEWRNIRETLIRVGEENLEYKKIKNKKCLCS